MRDALGPKAKQYQPLYSLKVPDTVSAFRLNVEPAPPREPRDADDDNVLLAAVGIKPRRRGA